MSCIAVRKSEDVSIMVSIMNLSEFAKVGLRTLVVAERTISESELKFGMHRMRNLL